MRNLATMEADLALAVSLGLPQSLRRHGHEFCDLGTEVRLSSGLVITITHENARRFRELREEAQHGA